MHEEIDLVQLARQVHAIWCQQMLRDGWRYGPHYDEAAKLHDALVPFDRLHSGDRLSALRAAQYDAVELLEGITSYTRGPARDFVAEEMQIDLPVLATDGDGSVTTDRGHVVDWVTQDGVLVMMVVQWDDGARSEHAPFSGELARVE